MAKLNIKKKLGTETLAVIQSKMYLWVRLQEESKKKNFLLPSSGFKMWEAKVRT